MACAVSGVEIDPDLCELGRLQCRAATVSQTVRAFVCGDVTAPLSRLFALGLTPDSFDHAVANPPFLLTPAEARLPPDPLLSRAHAAAPGELERWIKCLAAFVKPRGTVTMVHRADALPRLLSLCGDRFGGLAVYPLFAARPRPAARILFQGRKGSRAPLRLMHGMVLHGAGNGFTAEAEHDIARRRGS